VKQSKQHIVISAAMPSSISVCLRARRIFYMRN